MTSMDNRTNDTLSYIHLDDVTLQYNHSNRLEHTDTNTDNLALISMNVVQAIVSCIGCGANIAACVVLKNKSTKISAILRKLMVHQAVVDGIICLMATCQILTPSMWMTGIPAFDPLICQLWHGQGVFWATVLISIYNLVLIAVERFLTVCLPFRRSSLTSKRLKNIFIGCYVYSYVIQPLPSYLQVRYENGQCLSVYYFKARGFTVFMRVYATYTFLTFYIVPVIAFVIFYGSVIFKLRHRQRQNDALGSSRLVRTANVQLTKTAICVTAFFIVAMGYDLWYYVLGNTGVVIYVKNSLAQKIGLFLSVSNSCVNPFIYVMCMRIFRKSCVSIVTCNTTETPRPSYQRHQMNTSVDCSRRVRRRARKLSGLVTV